MRRSATELENAVLNVLGTRPLSAYQIARAVPTDVPILPPQVYRILYRLLQDGLVRRIELTKGYVRQRHGELALSCKACGTTKFVAIPEIFSALKRNADTTGFKVSRVVLECDGLCDPCTRAGT